MSRNAHARRLLALALTLAAAGCGGQSAVCPANIEKATVASFVADHYLFQDLLATSVNPDAYPDAGSYLDALVAPARAEGKDRYWSYLLSDAQYEAYFEQGQTAGFGIRFVVEGTTPTQRLLLADVYSKAPAGLAGFLRGDEILAIGPTAASLSPVATTSLDDLDALLAVSAGTSRVFQVKPVGGGDAVLRTMAAAASFDLEPVPWHQIFQDPAGDVGYVALRSFVAPANDLLSAAFADFKAAGVSEVVVDLRYNGGGYIDTAQLLASLLGADLAGKPMFEYTYNSKYGSSGFQTFSPEASAGTFTRIAFVTTGLSASASELVPNVLDPYKPIAFVGAKTYGKPVGQLIFDLANCDAKLFLISFALSNAVGHDGYFDGLPDATSKGPLCAAEDDLSHPMDSPDEASTAAAVSFVRTGACPATTSGATSLSRPRAARSPLLARTPTVAQRELPGLY